jgi:hypothetical protein
MWHCKPCATLLDSNSRLSQADYPQVVDPALHHRYRSITGCLSYLANMTSQDLVFAYSQLSKFVQYPGVVHLLSECCNYWIPEWYLWSRNYLLWPWSWSQEQIKGWVDSDFGSDADTRKSMTGYLMSLNGCAISWRSCRQEGVTISSRRRPQKYGKITRHVLWWAKILRIVIDRDMSMSLHNKRKKCEDTLSPWRPGSRWSCITCQMCRYSECFYFFA